MRGETGYKTRQRTVVEQVLRSTDGRHVTAEELVRLLADHGETVGRTTVYRTLERLAAEGRVRKYTSSAGESACYQYVADEAACREHFHLKCEKCGRLIHVECEHMDALNAHILSDHGFAVDRLKTVLYGVCRECAGR